MLDKKLGEIQEKFDKVTEVKQQVLEQIQSLKSKVAESEVELLRLQGAYREFEALMKEEEKPEDSDKKEE